MRNIGLISVALMMLAGCSAGPDAYSDAMRAEWDAERGSLAERAEFQANFAKSFDASAERAKAIAGRLGTADTISSNHQGAADRARSEAGQAKYLSEATFVRVKEVSCVDAGNMPGQNCEISFVVRGPDGKEDARTGAYRIDEREGRLTVVGPASGS